MLCDWFSVPLIKTVNCPEAMATPFRFEMDRLYAVSMAFFAAHPAENAAKAAHERACGILHLEEQEFTGITVQLVDLHCLRRANPEAHDSNITVAPVSDAQLASTRHLLVNM